LKVSLEEIGQRERLFRTSLSCYLSAISSVAQRAVESSRQLADAHGERLRVLGGKCLSDSGPLSLEQSQAALKEGLRDYSQRAEVFFREQEKELRRILGSVEEVAQSFGSNLEGGSAQCQQLAQRLESASHAVELNEVSLKLPDGVAQLRAIVDAMWRDGRVTVTELRSELQVFQRRLEQAEVLAATDPLTGLANRREAERLLADKVRARQRFCIMLFDLNEFKSVNDRYGHHVGDQVLRIFSRRLVEQYRSQDVVCRWGGDEFLVIVSGDLPAPMKRARGVAERLHGNYSIKSAGREITVDVEASVGIAEHKLGESSEGLFARADALLYQDKPVEGVA
jgi:diguanylate cyclase (GGDEF)-like protein